MHGGVWARRAKAKMSACAERLCEQPEPLNSSSLSRIRSRHVWQSVACVSPSDLSVSAYVLCIFFPHFFFFSSKHLLCKAGTGRKKKRICSYQGKSSQGSPTSQSSHVWLMSRSQEQQQPPAPQRSAAWESEQARLQNKRATCLWFVCYVEMGTLWFPSVTYADTRGRRRNIETRQKFWEWLVLRDLGITLNAREDLIQWNLDAHWPLTAVRSARTVPFKVAGGFKFLLSVGHVAHTETVFCRPRLYPVLTWATRDISDMFPSTELPSSLSRLSNPPIQLHLYPVWGNEHSCTPDACFAASCPWKRLNVFRCCFAIGL